MKQRGKFLAFARIISSIIAITVFVVFCTVGVGIWYLFPNLPSTTILKDARLQVPLRVYTRDGSLIAEFGEKRRIPLDIGDIPPLMINAVLAAEDKHFFEHPGVDWQGLMRAVVYLARTGEKGPGGSTITMQVARNFFLGREKTYLRKANEILLALKIEQELTKEEILRLYLNKIFFGQRAYGVGAAAQVYYGTTLDKLSLPQMAMIAGLPKAPSRFNPITDPVQAVKRRNYVLRRMRELRYIDDEQYDSSILALVTAKLHSSYVVNVQTSYVAEMVRAWMESSYKDAYTGSYRVYTTIHTQWQKYANEALRNTLLAYDRRHGYRGDEGHFTPIARDESPDPGTILAKLSSIGNLVPALVKTVEKKSVRVIAKKMGEVELPWEALSWARPYVDRNRRGPVPRTAAKILAPGDVVRLEKTESRWLLAQIPEVQGALVAMDPLDGAILALVGGFDFYHSKFNRATQAKRQPGSSFKPFIYSVALDAGFTPASIINDAPIVFKDLELETNWRPKNYSGKFYGPTRLREALVRSRNLVSIRLLRTVGIQRVLGNLPRFGFEPRRLPSDLSLALGSGTVTLLELVTAYSIFANGGYRVEPYFVDSVLNGDEEVIFKAEPLQVCRECEVTSGRYPKNNFIDVLASVEMKPLPEDGEEIKSTIAEATHHIAPRIISAENAWLINSMLRDVINRGTGIRAKKLGRTDLGGKTGTSNEQKDAWFCGFMPDLVAASWVGFDEFHPLGARENGGRTALPMWMEFMGKALDGIPEKKLERPNGLVSIRIDKKTGRRTDVNDPNSIFETFRIDNVPQPTTVVPGVGRIMEKLF
uniref:Penicillin-binding protein 1A n=1 Tax=Candidatus Kentrum sp. SD TaxID=2126332 RepID=A0A450Y5S4_9GAMM|nr:MAG: penicillin-binding protein 1A [Candidatus Kentron sp. SD]VFK40510.1 MAG: penicillin-binding protein 1A [Candidatus Kentron sp. SD]VFK78357.1 MAG: penicillin-binding protein 1A [Candidatus Kentron sp. SD]